MVLTSNGGAYGYGYDQYGRLGTGTQGSTFDYQNPNRMDVNNIVQLELGHVAGVALTGGGSVRYWPESTSSTTSYSSSDYDVGTMSSDAFTEASAVRFVRPGGISMETNVWCVLFENEEAMPECWGDNSVKMLGQGSSTTDSWDVPLQVQGLPSGNFTQLRCGTYHCCAVVNGTSVWCWGSNSYGALGDGTATTRDAPVRVSGLAKNITDISVGSRFSCAIEGTAADGTTGAVACWGYNNYGQVGDGTATTRYSAVDTGLRDAETVSCGQETNPHTCASTSANELYCWGYNYYCQLGDGTTTARYSPVEATAISDKYTIGELKVGYLTTYVRTEDGAVLGWGYNGYGQLGDGTKTTQCDGVFVGVYEGTPLPVRRPLWALVVGLDGPACGVVGFFGDGAKGWR